MTEIDLEAIARHALEAFPPDGGDRDLARDFARRLLFKDHARSIGPGEIEAVGRALDRAVDGLDPGARPVAAPASEPVRSAPAPVSDAEIEECVARGFDAVHDGSPGRADMIAGRARAALDRLIAIRDPAAAAEIRARAEPIIERYRGEIARPPGRSGD